MGRKKFVVTDASLFQSGDVLVSCFVSEKRLWGLLSDIEHSAEYTLFFQKSSIFPGQNVGSYVARDASTGERLSSQECDMLYYAVKSWFMREEKEKQRV